MTRRRPVARRVFDWKVSDYDKSLTFTEKICSIDREELSQWANNEGVHRTICNDCMRD
jgi:hypothetical protein